MARYDVQEKWLSGEVTFFVFDTTQPTTYVRDGFVVFEQRPIVCECVDCWCADAIAESLNKIGNIEIGKAVANDNMGRTLVCECQNEVLADVICEALRSNDDG